MMNPRVAHPSDPMLEPLEQSESMRQASETVGATSRGAVLAAVPTASDRRIRSYPIGHLAPNPFQPRFLFDDDALAQLAGSIRSYGFMGHIEVRHDPIKPDGPLQIVFGHRRVEAAKLGGLATVPAVLVERTDDQMRCITFVENAARKSLSYWEEAVFLGTMKRELKLTVRQIADALGVGRSYVQERLDLLKLPEGPLRDAAQRHDVGFSTAWLLTQMPEEERDELFAGVQAGELNVTDLRLIRQAEARRRSELERRVDDDQRPGEPSVPVVSIPRPQPVRMRWVEPPTPFTDTALQAARGDHPKPEPAPWFRPNVSVIAAIAEPIVPAEPRHSPVSTSLRDTPRPATSEQTIPAQRIFFDSTLIKRHTGRDYALEAIKQLDANAYHLRLKIDKADFAMLSDDEREHLKRATSELQQVLALLPS